MLALLLGCWISPCDGLDDDQDGACFPMDCAPQDPAVYPGAEEVCDGVDNNCDGSIDEGACGAEGVTVPGSGAYAGPVVVSQGPDWDRDNLPELIVGAPLLGDGGGVLVLFDGQVSAGAVPQPLLLGAPDGVEWGYSAASLSHPDCTGLLVGDPGLDDDTGAAYFLGALVVEPRIGDAAATVTPSELLRGGASGGRSGETLAAALINDTAAGIVSEPGSNRLFLLTDLCGQTQVRSMVSAEDRAGFGAALLGHDATGDGSDEIVFSSPSGGSPYIALVSGDPFPETGADAVWRLEQDGNTQLGRSLASADLNDDGYRELIVGAPALEEDGAAMVLDGALLAALEGTQQLSSSDALVFATIRPSGSEGAGIGWAVHVTDGGGVLIGACPLCVGADEGGGGWLMAAPLGEGSRSLSEARHLSVDSNAAGASVASLPNHRAVLGRSGAAETDSLAWIFALD